MGKMTLNDLNTILSQSVDISTNDYINTDLKTSIINQDLSNNDLVPSIQNAILLKNKYEVLKVDKDFNGTLEELIKQQGKKNPTNLPFVNILLVGGGSSGGWIPYSKDDGLFEAYGSGVAGSIKYIPNYKISLDTNINIIIGKGGNSKSRSIWNKNDFESNILQYLPNPGEDSIFIDKKSMIDFIAFGGYSIQDNENDRHGGIQSSSRTDNYYDLAVPFYYRISSASTQSVYDFRTDYKLVSKFNINNIKLNDNNNFIFPYEYYFHYPIGNIGLNMICKQNVYSHNTGTQLSKTYHYAIMNECIDNNLDNIKKYLEGIRTSLKNRPRKKNEGDKYYTYNDYGVYQDDLDGSVTYEHQELIFFDGIDAYNHGMSGLSGSYATWAEYHAGGQRFQRGYMGKGGDGVCYIYYPKEV